MTDTISAMPPKMGMLEAVKICMKKYAVFKGRARRAEFWWFYLFTMIAASVATSVDSLIVGRPFDNTGLLESITSLALFLPTITAMVRRLHDTGRSGWWIVLPPAAVFVSVILAVVMPIWIVIGVSVVAVFIQIVWLCQASEPGTNAYGANPITDPNGDNIAEVFE